MGVHETIMRSAIADISPFYKRGTSYGIFNSVYGLALFAGAWIMGFLYDQKNFFLIISFILISQIVAFILFFLMNKEIKKI